MTSTTATTAPMRAALPRRLTSRRTAWILAATAAVAVAATATAVSLRPSETPRPAGAPAGHSPFVRADAGEAAHGSGAAVSTGAGLRVRGQAPGAPGRSLAAAVGAKGPAVLPDAESFQLVHGTRGSLSDAAGQPLGAGVVAGR